MRRKRGSTSQLIRVFIQDSSSTTGAGLTGLTSGSAGLGFSYAREGDTSATAITLAAGTVGTWSSGGFAAVDATLQPGVYELGLPNAALASGNSVTIYGKGATNMAPVVKEVELDAIDFQDAVRFGLSALPNASAGANTGLPVVGTQIPNATAAAAGGLPTVGTGAGQVPTFPTNFSALAVTSGGAVTAGTVSDKTGYALTSGEHTTIGTDVQTGLTAQGYTTTRAGYLDTLSGLVSAAATAVWAYVVGDVTSDADGRSNIGKMVRSVFARDYNKVTKTDTTLTVYNDAGTAVSTMATSDTGSLATKDKSA